MNQLLNNGGRVARAMVELGSLVLWAAVTGGTPLALAAVPYLRTHVPHRTTHFILSLSPPPPPPPQPLARAGTPFLLLGLPAGFPLGFSSLNLTPEIFKSPRRIPAD